jgi:hypothetical protein
MFRNAFRVSSVIPGKASGDDPQSNLFPVLSIMILIILQQIYQNRRITGRTALKNHGVLALYTVLVLVG